MPGANGCMDVCRSKAPGLRLFGHLLLHILPKDICVQVRRELRSAGISEFTLFPDVDGLSRDIRAAEVEGC